MSLGRTITNKRLPVHHKEHPYFPPLRTLFEHLCGRLYVPAQSNWAGTANSKGKRIKH